MPRLNKSLKGTQRIAVEFAFIINAAHPWALNEIVGQNFVPQINDFF